MITKTVWNILHTLSEHGFSSPLLHYLRDDLALDMLRFVDAYLMFLSHERGKHLNNRKQTETHKSVLDVNILQYIPKSN